MVEYNGTIQHIVSPEAFYFPKQETSLFFQKSKIHITTIVIARFS